MQTLLAFSTKDDSNFLGNFPSETSNLEKLLLNRFASTEISKCSWADANGRYQRDEGPFGPHPFKKNDGFIHPNRKY